jgi:pyruvyl transferase EpsO
MLLVKQKMARINLTASDNNVLFSLKARLHAIAEGITPDRRVIYVDYPLHPNIGDLLINLGTEEFFKDYRINVRNRFTYHDFPRQISDLGEKDIFMFHGGGNFGDIYPEHLMLLTQIVEQYPNHQIIVLPQTVHFSDHKKLTKTCATLSKHERLSIYTRDELSLKHLVDCGLHTVTMMPDMAHQLAGKLSPNPATGSGEPLYFFRKDIETKGMPSILADKSATAVDWNDSFSFRDHLAFHLIYRIAKYSSRTGVPVRMQKLWYPIRDSFVENGIKMFSNAPRIYTDRLHAMLLSVFLGRDVVAFDNSYGKLSGYYDAWLRNSPLITFVETSRYRG